MALLSRVVRASLALELPSLVALLVASAAACQPETVAPGTVGSSGGHDIGGGGGTANEAGVSSSIDGGAGGNVLASVIAPQAIVLDSTNVYWTTAKGLMNAGGVDDASAGTGSVETVSRAGGAVTEVINGLVSPSSLAIAGNTLFLADGSGTSGELRVYPLNSTACTPVALDQFAPFPIAVNSNASTLFWVTSSVTSGGAQLAARSVPTGDPIASAVTELGSNADAYQPIAATVLGNSLFVLASDGANAAVLSVPPAGIGNGKPTVLWQASSVTAADLTSSGDTLYFALANTPANGGEILHMPASGGGALTLATGQVNPGRVAVFDSIVYFTSNVASGAVLSVAASGGGVTTLATGLDYPYPLAVDDAVYVGTATAILAVAK